MKATVMVAGGGGGAWKYSNSEYELLSLEVKTKNTKYVGCKLIF
jgi:hypothetical protein